VPRGSPQPIYSSTESFRVVRISFHHANPGHGNESFLLRFDPGDGEAACVLVDAGHGVEPARLLGPTDRLAAICLTHAHLDHYAALTAAHRDGVPVLTSPATAAILGDVFDVADAEYDVHTSAAVTDAITAVDGWTTVAPGIDVHPVPAGHAPGAVGFLLRADDDGRTHHLLATGDFTRRRAAGFPGFDPDGFVDVDALFLTAATDDRFESSLTDALGTALEHAHGGAPTLLATSGLVGVQAAYLLAAVAEEYDRRVPVRVVGQVAKLYEALEYDCPGVESVPLFRNTGDCLGPGTIAIAGPEIPRERSSGRLFGVLRENPNACVVQLVGSGETPMTDARCTIHSHELVNHPTRETLVDVHDALDPVHTVVTHRHGGAEGAFNDLSSVVWGTGDSDEYTLFDGRAWRLPPWMAGERVAERGDRSVGRLVGADLLPSIEPPSVGRHADADLESEGIRTDELATQLHRGPDGAGGRDDPTRTAADGDGETTTERTTTTMDDSNSTDRDGSRPPAALVRTTGPDLGDDLDPAVRAALEAGSITERELAALAARERTEGRAAADAGDPAASATGASTDDATDAPAADDATPTDPAEASGADAAADEPPPSDGDATADAADDATVDDATAAAADGTSAGSSGTARPASPEAVELSVNPLAFALAERAADEAGFDSADRFVVEAVDRYVAALLAGDATGTEEERFTVDVAAAPAVERALEDVVADDERFASTAALAADGLAAALGSEPTTPRAIEGMAAHRRRLDAVVANDAYAFTDVAAVVEAAIVRFVDDD
jgi:putative mRNA 3-end processing factor